MILYHCTTPEAAESIVGGGFRAGVIRAGVWLSTAPCSVSEGAKGYTVLEVDLDMAEGALMEYEEEDDSVDFECWTEEELTWMDDLGDVDRKRFYELLIERVFVMPAALITKRGKVRIVREEEEDTWSCAVMRESGMRCNQFARTYDEQLRAMVCRGHAAERGLEP